MPYNQCVICSKRKTVMWRLMTLDRPDCTNGFSCSDWATFNRITLTFFSKSNASGSPHPATVIPFPALPCAPPLCWHDCPCHHELKWLRINPVKISSQCFTGLFFGLSSLLSVYWPVAHLCQHNQGDMAGAVSSRKSNRQHLDPAIASLPLPPALLWHKHLWGICDTDPCWEAFLTKLKNQTKVIPPGLLFSKINSLLLKVSWSQNLCPRKRMTWGWKVNGKSEHIFRWHSSWMPHHSFGSPAVLLVACLPPK